MYHSALIDYLNHRIDLIKGAEWDEDGEIVIGRLDELVKLRKLLLGR